LSIVYHGQRRKSSRYRLAATAGDCYQDIDYDPLNGDQNVVTDYAHAYQAPNAQHTHIIRGPDGQPWCSFLQRDSSGLLYGFEGPFVVRWDDPNWVFVDDVGSSDGGLGQEQVNGATTFDIQGAAAGSGASDLWGGVSGTFNVGNFGPSVFTGTITPFIACDGENVYVIRSHAQVYEHTANNYNGRRSWWEVMMWDGSSWAELDDGVAHTHVAADFGGADILGSTLGRATPKLVASAQDVGHPFVLYRDTTATTNDLYVSQWDGSDWNDLGGAIISIAATPPDSTINYADISIDSQGRPTVVWTDDNDDEVFSIATLKSGSWVIASVNVNTLYGVTGFFALDNIHISAVAPKPGGTWGERFFITVKGNRGFGFGSVLYVAEYFPEEEWVQPMLGDPDWSHVDPLDGAALEHFAFAPDPNDRGVWIIHHPGGSNGVTVYRFDPVCLEVWTGYGDPISSGPSNPLSPFSYEGKEAFPPYGYRNGLTLYFENAYGDFNQASGAKLAHKGIIGCVECPPPSWAFAHFFLDGVSVGTDSAYGLDGIGFMLVGAIASGSANDHQIDDVKVGTSDGASDVFSADFASAIVPPFDSTTGSGISASGGQMVISNAGTDAYATKTEAWDPAIYPDLWIELKVTIGAPELVGSFTADFIEWFDSSMNFWDGFFVRVSTLKFDTYGDITPFGSVSAGVQYRLQVHFSQT
jgi:hypothetical protein